MLIFSPSATIDDIHPLLCSFVGSLHFVNRSVCCIRFPIFLFSFSFTPCCIICALPRIRPLTTLVKWFKCYILIALPSSRVSYSPVFGATSLLWNFMWSTIHKQRKLSGYFLFALFCLACVVFCLCFYFCLPSHDHRRRCPRASKFARATIFLPLLRRSICLFLQLTDWNTRPYTGNTCIQTDRVLFELWLAGFDIFFLVSSSSYLPDFYFHFSFLLCHGLSCQNE